VNLAPNGKPSNLTPEQYRLVRTPAFKEWFGDWENDPENSSKLVDNNGEPLVVYHGTKSKKKINIFKHDIEKRTDKGFHGANMFYFTPRKSYANGYAYRETGTSGKVYSCFLNIRNPFITNENKSEKPKENDGSMIYYKEFSLITHYGKLYEIGVEKPNQIKLADGSNTTFDASSDDIRYEIGGATKAFNYTIGGL
jgi:hypothetical protein